MDFFEQHRSLLESQQQQQQQQSDVTIRASSLSRSGARRIDAPPIGNLEVQIGRAKLLLLGNPISAQESLIKKYEWKVMVSCNGKVGETEATVISRRGSQQKAKEAGLLSNPATIVAEDDSGDGDISTLSSSSSTVAGAATGSSTDSYTPLHEAYWGEKIDLKQIKDLWADVCIDVYWRRSKSSTSSTAATTNAREIYIKYLQN